jgi:di/tricarboxylate transporter
MSKHNASNNAAISPRLAIGLKAWTVVFVAAFIAFAVEHTEVTSAEAAASTLAPLAAATAGAGYQLPAQAAPVAAEAEEEEHIQAF